VEGVTVLTFIKGFDAVIEIASLGIDLPLAEIYAGVECR